MQKAKTYIRLDIVQEILHTNCRTDHALQKSKSAANDKDFAAMLFPSVLKRSTPRR